MLKKNELRDRLAVIRKAFDKETKEREQTLQKAVSITLYYFSHQIKREEVADRLHC